MAHKRFIKVSGRKASPGTKKGTRALQQPKPLPTSRKGKGTPNPLPIAKRHIEEDASSTSSEDSLNYLFYHQSSNQNLI